MFLIHIYDENYITTSEYTNTFIDQWAVQLNKRVRSFWIISGDYM